MAFNPGSAPWPYAVRMEFRQGDHGWSEDFYLLGGTSPGTASLSAAKALLATTSGIVGKRMACSPPDVQLQWVKVRDMSQEFHVQTYLPSDLTLGSGVGTFATIGENPSAESAPNNLCSAWRLYDGNFHSTLIRVHGIPLGIVTGEDSFVFGTVYTVNIDAYATSLATYAGIKVRKTNTYAQPSACTVFPSLHYRKTGRPSGLPSGRRMT